MKAGKTERGFSIINFIDRYNENCSIQKSSLATEEAIWIGVDNPKLTVFENEDMGRYLITEMPKNFQVSCRMHLTQDMVRELIPVLQRFVDTGEI